METLEGTAGGAAALPVHRGEHGDFRDRPLDLQPGGDGGIQVVGHGRGGQRRIAGDDGQDPRLDLAEVGAHKRPAGRCRDRGPHGRREVVKSVLRGHPAGGAVAGGPGAAQTIVRPDVIVEPGVAIGGGDAFVGPPGQERGHERVRVAIALQHPLAGGLDGDAEAGEEGLDRAGIAQVGRVVARGQREHGRVASRPNLLLVRGISWPRPGGTGDEVLGAGPVEGEPVTFQLDAQHGYGRLGDGEREGARSDRGELSIERLGARMGRLGPAFEPTGHGEPVAVGRVGPQVAVGDREVVWARLLPELAEQVIRCHCRYAARVQPVRPGPDAPGVGAPAAPLNAISPREVEHPGEQHRSEASQPPPG